MAVCSKEGVDNLVTNGTLIALQHIMNEDDMALEVLDFNKEHLARELNLTLQKKVIHIYKDKIILKLV